MNNIRKLADNFVVLKVVSNFLEYNSEGEIEGFKGTTVHVLNKNEYFLKGTDYFKLIEDRENVILLGDSLGDAGMAGGMPHCNAVLKIGFLYDHVMANVHILFAIYD